MTLLLPIKQVVAIILSLIASCAVVEIDDTRLFGSPILVASISTTAQLAMSDKIIATTCFMGSSNVIDIICR
jgi:hypothetical protein